MNQHKITQIEDRCREQGLALTVQRRIILRELIDRIDHPTADQIFESVQSRIPGLSRTTVYRVLDTLVKLGAAQKVAHPDAVVRFDPNTERHHHLVCNQCGRMVDLDDSLIRELGTPGGDLAGFSVLDYSVNFTGICKECRSPN